MTESGERARAVRRAAVAEAGAALSILLEAAAWGAARGTDIWSEQELRAIDFRAAAAAGELALGFEGSDAVATMLLQRVDPIYWPDDPPGLALYLHKVAVRRANAGRDWLSRLIEFAVAEARLRGINLLRMDTILRPHLQSMYERHGFAVVVEPPLIMSGRQMIRMERWL
jgi:GNAT superfamily N-acetyltransferase